MADTIRELVIKDFMARAAIIKISAGYATSIGTTVIRARKKLEAKEVPGTVIIPGKEDSENQYGKRSCSMDMHVEGIAEFGANDPSVISEKMLGDLKKCFLSSSWSRSPDYIDRITYTSGGTDEYPDDDHVTIGAYANFKVDYTEKLDDPCSQ